MSFSFLEPGAPENVSLVPISSTQLRLSWETPLKTNGEISEYYITWRIVRNDTNHTVDGLLSARSEDGSMTSYDITDLGKY